MKRLFIFLFAIVIYSCNNNGEAPGDKEDTLQQPQAKPDTTLKEGHKPKQ